MESQPTFNLRGMVEASAPRLLDLHSDFVNPAYVKVLRTIGFDVNYASARGAYLFDDQGRKYIDCLGGYAIYPLGRNSPEIQDAICQAMDLQLPNLPGIGGFKLAGLLAQKLLEIAPGNFGKVFFASAGAEAVDAAIKMARIYTARPGVVYCHRGYHGLTIGALSVTGNAEFRDGFGELLASTVEIPFNDLSALERELSTGRHAAFIVEPIQGKGVNLPSESYLREAAALCKKHGTVFILDEIQVGIGRTGKWFASEHYGCGRPEQGGSWQPDIIVVAKALSGGYVPVSAVIARDEVHRAVFSSMANCSKMQNTFSMNDLSMTTGLATLHYMRERETCAHVSRVGDYLIAGLRDRLRRFEMFKEVRGQGLIIGIEFQRPTSLGLRLGWDMVHKLDESLFCQAILMPLLTDHRVLAQVAGHRLDVIKLIPPLTLNEADCDQIIAAFEATVGACHSLAGPMWAVGKKLAAAKLRPAGV